MNRRGKEGTGSKFSTLSGGAGKKTENAFATGLKKCVPGENYRMLPRIQTRPYKANAPGGEKKAFEAGKVHFHVQKGGKGESGGEGSGKLPTGG